MISNFYELLASRFPTDRSRPCFLLTDETISYGELELGTKRLAGLLILKGVKPGDRVAVQAQKSPQVVMLYLAVLMVGAVYLPLNTGYTPHEIRYFLEDSEPTLIVTDVIALVRQSQAILPLSASVSRSDDDLAAIVYTSGTTGRSKGAMVTHGNMTSNALALHQAWGFTSGDVLLHALPIFHIHGLFVALHTALLSGSPMVWLAKYDVDQVLNGLPHSTVMMGVPTFYSRLLDHPGFTRQIASGMRLFVSGSAPLLETTFIEFERRTGHRILERYGMSETGIITSNPLAGERVPGSVGYPLEGVELRIDGEDVGGIEVKGPNVFSAYWRQPEKTREEFTDDGFFKTGDVGRLDAEGRLWISGRAKDLIISGGFNIYPREVEMVLDDLAGVVESAVIGVPHPDFGEVVIALVVGEGDEKAIISSLREQLAAFKTPKRIIFTGELPRNAMGKVQKASLRQRYSNLFIVEGSA